MSGPWKPGDVAMIKAANRRTEYRAYFDGKTWREHEHDMFWVDQPTSYRPLVVIDPEDREQVERLYLLIQQAYTLARRGVLPALASALREFANPTPKPEEPKVRAALVADTDGALWARQCSGSEQQDMSTPWLLVVAGRTARKENDQRSWRDVDAVSVEFEGVTS